ncbi:MAG: hypothetical protein E7354_05190 [Clostridiales bacterium]|nr:hypothetical protein [Clostridiales bacterium]
MSELIGSVFSFIFGNHSIIATILISMFPIIELKGAIPIGMSVDYWGAFALNGTEAFLYSLLGSCLVVPIIALVFTPILNWFKKTKLFRKFGDFIDEKVKKHSKQISEQLDGDKAGKWKTLVKCLLIFGFVAIPLPLTGVWTGTCVAVVVGLKFWQTILSVILGNVVAGLIIVFVCSIFPQIITILSIIFIAIVLMLVVITIIKVVLSNKKAEEKNDTIESVKNNEEK